MRSLTFLLLLLVSSVSGTIYWGFGEESDDNNSIAIVDEIQTQINLILHAFENNDTDLLHQLTKNGGVIEEYLKSHRNQIYYVRVRSVFYRSEYGSATAVVEIHKAHGYGNSYCAEVDMSSNKSSVTGYILYGRKVVDCDY